VGLWGTVFSQALFYQEWPRTILLTLIPDDTPILGRITGGVYVYNEGLSYGLIQGLRFSTMTALGLLFCWTTESRAALLALTSLKVPYGIAFMMVTTLRFFPILLKEVFTVIEAQRLKGFYPFRIQNIFRATLNTLMPILANSIKRAITLSSSVESRAFNAYPQRTYFRQLSYGVSDLGLMVFFAIMALTTVFIKILYSMYTRDILYFSYLRWIYELGEIL
jgi:energy-coupling factor transport system permease protein